MTLKISGLEPLIEFLRLHLGDIGTTPTYSDETLHAVLRYSVESLGPRWGYRYYLDANNVVQRSTNYAYWRYISPPVIQRSDTRAVVLQAAIIIKSGEVRSNTGGAVSWRDDEISYDATQVARYRNESLKQDITELNQLLPVKLAGAQKRSLGGFLANPDENSDYI